MMSVKELLNSPILNREVSVEGCIVIIDDKLWLIDSNHINDFPNSIKVVIANSNLKPILLKNVALYSGVTSLFHDARICGHMTNNNPLHSFALNVDELRVNDGGEWKDIDINDFVEDEKSKEDKYPDWFDLLK